MSNIINDNIYHPKPYVVESFKNGNFTRLVISSGTSLYRIVTKEDPPNQVAGNNFVNGEFWIDHETFTKIASNVNYDSPLKSITGIARNGLAITTKFSLIADSIIAITIRNFEEWNENDLPGWPDPIMDT
jgi:hypothetical protein